jgi:putative ABC transport system ATP-binding protein
MTRLIAPETPGIGREKPAAAMPMVKGLDVRKTYRLGGVEVEALRGVNIAINRGEMVAIMGPSGCGKTTLLNCLSGLDEIDSGDVLIEDVSIKQMSDRDRTRYRARRMGFVFQFYNLLGVLTAVENVEMPLLLAGVPGKQARKKAQSLLELVGLGERADHTPEELSGGERQRVTIARSLVNDPAIVWADEPTGDLDSTTADGVMELMQRLNREQGITFAIVTHDISIGRRAHRIIRMMDGQVVDEIIPVS